MYLLTEKYFYNPKICESKFIADADKQFLIYDLKFRFFICFETIKKCFNITNFKLQTIEMFYFILSK